ncbi:hypothetical protein HMPREF3037_01105 [Candidatus Stoquefichus sp. KLE1796]|nr:hypothetical protein HMPREF3037_01105 [Candidatus Stoquefichus sp. KLE1796]
MKKSICIILGKYMNLLKYEWKKLFVRKIFIIVFIGFILLNIGLIAFQYKTDFLDKQLSTAEKYYALEFTGKITKEKVTKLSTLIEQVSNETNKDYKSGGKEGDIIVLQSIYDDMRSRYTYHQDMQTYLKVLTDNIDYFKNQNVEQQYNTFLYNEYKDRQITTYDYIVGWNQLFHYDKTIILMSFVVIFGVVLMISNERDSHMDVLLKTSIKGRKYFQKIRFIHMISFVLIVVIAFSITELLTFLILYGFHGLFEPLYALKDFYRSSISCNMLQCYFLIVLMRLIIMLFLVQIIQVISKYIPHYILAFFLSALIILGLIVVANDTQVFNPFALLQESQLFIERDCIQIGPLCMFTYQWLMLIGVGYNLILAIMSLIGKEGVSYET